MRYFLAARPAKSVHLLICSHMDFWMEQLKQEGGLDKVLINDYMAQRTSVCKMQSVSSEKSFTHVVGLGPI